MKGILLKESKIDKEHGTVFLVVFNQTNRGPVVLYELLVKKGHRCKFIYFLHDDKENRDSLCNLIKEMNTILIGFSFASQSSIVAFDLASFLSLECKGIPIIFGGVHPTVDPVSCLDYCYGVCVGEGEKALLEVVDKIKKGEDFFQSKNIVCKKDGKIIVNINNPLISNLDDLPIRRPFTDDHLIVENGRIVKLNQKKYFEILPSEKTCYTQIFSRGCPYGCSYCCNSKYRGIYRDWSKIRSMSVQSIIDEIYFNINLNPHIIKVFIIDDCFLAHDIEWIEEFTELWKSKVNKELNFFTIPEYVTREKLEVLKTIDLSYCSLGLQSGSEKTNKQYKRKFSKDLFLEGCDLIRSMNIGIVINVIFDNPWEDSMDLLETIDILTRIKKPFYIMQYSLKVYPGTKLYNDCIEKCMDIPDYNLWYDNYNVIQKTDKNRIMILSQFLPRSFIMYLFKNSDREYVKIFLRILFIMSLILMPFHALRISGSKRMLHNIAIVFSHREYALTWIKGLLGIRGKKSTS